MLSQGRIPTRLSQGGDLDPLLLSSSFGAPVTRMVEVEFFLNRQPREETENTTDVKSNIYN